MCIKGKREVTIHSCGHRVPGNFDNTFHDDCRDCNCVYSKEHTPTLLDDINDPVEMKIEKRSDEICVSCKLKKVPKVRRRSEKF